MILKKFYGKDIKEAREEAFEKLGPDCIVLESRNASDGQDAWVTVMVDNIKEEVLKDPAKRTSPEKKEGYSRKDLLPKSLNKMKDAVAGGFSQLSTAGDPQRASLQEADASPDASSQENSRSSGQSMSKRNTSLYTRSQAKQKKENGAGFEQSLAESVRETPVSQEVKALHRRFDHMEKLMSDALISANLEYVSHPAYQQLLNTGMQATTISDWFKRIINKGIDPYDQNQSFMYELADIVRSALSFAIPESTEQNLLFVGPSGSGKTSLIMKLVTHPDFMLNKSVALVSIEPKNGQQIYSPLKLFAEDKELPFYVVRDGVEMSSLKGQLEEFDHVLFDTPPISLQQEAAFRDFWKYRQMISSVTPLEIHYTVNATLERYYFKESYATNHPLQPDYLAITHMDETDKWGHLIPFIDGIGASIRYITRGPNSPDHLHTFRPEWFAKQLLSES